MTKNRMKPLWIGNLKIEVPIIQGGMGIGISLSNLASAVANEGGVGVISTAGVGMFTKDMAKNFNQSNINALKKEIQTAKKLTKGVLGVNIMVAMTNFAEMVKTAISEKIDIIFAGAGLPLDLPKYITHSTKTKLVPIISSARAAVLITKKWLRHYNYLPDAFVIEGPKAGGHLGFKPEQLDDPDFALDHILEDVIKAIKPFEKDHNKKIPLIVGGGVYTGEDIHYYLSRGAAAVQMATRFVTTDECDASLAFKQCYIDAEASDITIIKSPVGLPGRAINNAYLDAVEAGKKQPFSCPYDCIITCAKEAAPYCISLALFNAKKGKLNNGFAFAGTNAYKADTIVSVHDLMNELHTEYNKWC